MSAAAAALAVGDVIGGKYRVERVLGQGGMGTVYLAENLDIGRKVALKTLHPRLVEDAGLVARFRQEARAATAIGHPGIIDVLDLGTTTDGTPFIVMEWLDGESAGERAERLGRLPLHQVVTVCAAALDALAAAHARGVVHRDLKPDNLFLVERPVAAVKLLDFGISKLTGADELSVTRTGEIMGTPLYMSPEQARGAREIGPPTDLWAMGAILFHLLAGRPPFLGDSYNELIARLLTEDVPALTALRPGLPPALVALVEQLLRKTATARPTAAAARDALRAVAGELEREAATFDDTLAPTADALAATGAPTPVFAGARATRAPVSATSPPRRPWRVGAFVAAGGAALVVALFSVGRSFERHVSAARDDATGVAEPSVPFDAASGLADATDDARVIVEAPAVAPIDAGRRPRPRPDATGAQVDAGARGELGIDDHNPLRTR